MPFECATFEDFQLAADGSEKFLLLESDEEIFIGTSQFFFYTKSPTTELTQKVKGWLRGRTIVRIKGFRRPEDVLKA